MMGPFAMVKMKLFLQKLNALLIFHMKNHELMLLDIQGCGYRLFDPEIASTTLMDGNEILFTTGNLSKEAIDTFIKGHVCNVYCNQLKLQRL